MSDVEVSLGEEKILDDESSPSFYNPNGDELVEKSKQKSIAELLTPKPVYPADKPWKKNLTPTKIVKVEDDAEFNAHQQQPLDNKLEENYERNEYLKNGSHDNQAEHRSYNTNVQLEVSESNMDQINASTAQETVTEQVKSYHEAHNPPTSEHLGNNDTKVHGEQTEYYHEEDTGDVTEEYHESNLHENNVNPTSTGRPVEVSVQSEIHEHLHEDDIKAHDIDDGKESPHLNENIHDIAAQHDEANNGADRNTYGEMTGRANPVALPRKDSVLPEDNVLLETNEISLVENNEQFEENHAESLVDLTNFGVDEKNHEENKLDELTVQNHNIIDNEESTAEETDVISLPTSL